MSSRAKFLAAGKRPVDRPPLSLPEATKLDGETSKYCPICLQYEGVKVARTRIYHLVGPLSEAECDKTLPVKIPRFSSHPTWEKLRLAWLVSPHWSSPWFESRCFAMCRHKPKNPDTPKHDVVRVTELEYRRQFGWSRRVGIWFKRVVFRSIELIVPTR